MLGAHVGEEAPRVALGADRGAEDDDVLCSFGAALGFRLGGPADMLTCVWRVRSQPDDGAKEAMRWARRDARTARREGSGPQAPEREQCRTSMEPMAPPALLNIHRGSFTMYLRTNTQFSASP